MKKFRLIFLLVAVYFTAAILDSFVPMPYSASVEKAWIGAAIGAAGSLLGGLFNSAGASKKQKREEAFQREMLKEQQAYNDKVNAEQMAYQDKVNAENREWNTESNVRERIEAAGYNPYLYQGNAQAGGASVSSGANLSTGTSSLPSTSADDPMSVFGQTIAGASSNFASQMSAAVDADIKAYNLQKARDNDNYVMKDGQRVYFGPARETENKLREEESRIRKAESDANLSAWQQWQADMRRAFLERPATDENDVPITDESGRQLTNYEALMDSEQKAGQKAVYRALAELGKINADTRLADIMDYRQRLQVLLGTDEATYKQILAITDNYIMMRKYNAAAAENQRAQAADNYSHIAVNQSQSDLNKANRDFVIENKNKTIEETLNLKELREQIKTSTASEKVKKQLLDYQNDTKVLDFWLSHGEKIAEIGIDLAGLVLTRGGSTVIKEVLKDRHGSTTITTTTPNRLGMSKRR